MTVELWIIAICLVMPFLSVAVANARKKNDKVTRLENSAKLAELKELNDEATKYLDEVIRLSVKPDIVGFKVQFDMDTFIKEHEIKIEKTSLFIRDSKVINNQNQSSYWEIGDIRIAFEKDGMLKIKKRQVELLHAHLHGWKVQRTVADTHDMLAEMLKLGTKK